jgi:hypothetical protein
MTPLEKLDHAFLAVTNSIDDTGCSDGLVVLDGNTLEALSIAIAECREKTRELIEAANACLQNACDSDIVTPENVDETCDDYPRDGSGDPWFHDWWDLYNALNEMEGAEAIAE